MKSFTLDATVSTDKPSAILPALKRLAGKGATVKKAVAEAQESANTHAAEISKALSDTEPVKKADENQKSE